MCQKKARAENDYTYFAFSFFTVLIVDKIMTSCHLSEAMFYFKDGLHRGRIGIKTMFQRTDTTTTHRTVVNQSSHQSPAGCTCSSLPLPLTRETSPGPVGPPHLGSYPDAFSCNRSPGDGLQASSGGADVVRAIV